MGVANSYWICVGVILLVILMWFSLKGRSNLEKKGVDQKISVIIKGLALAFKDPSFYVALGVLSLFSLAVCLLTTKPIVRALTLVLMGTCLAGEVFNGAIEASVDRSGKEWDELGARSKDYAATACAILYAGFVGWCLWGIGDGLQIRFRFAPILNRSLATNPTCF